MADILEQMTGTVEIDDISFAQYLYKNGFLTKKPYIEVKLNNSFTIQEDDKKESEEVVTVLKSLRPDIKSIKILSERLKPYAETTFGNHLDELLTHLVNNHLSSLPSEVSDIQIESVSNDYIDLEEYIRSKGDSSAKVLRYIERTVNKYLDEIMDNIAVLDREDYIKCVMPFTFKIHKIMGYNKVIPYNGSHMLNAPLDSLLTPEALNDLEEFGSVVVGFKDYSQKCVSPHKIRRIFTSPRHNHVTFSRVI